MDLAKKMVDGSFVVHPAMDPSYCYMHSTKYGDESYIAKVKTKPEVREFGGNYFYSTWP